MRSSSHVWSQVKQANRASKYSVLAGWEFRNVGWKLEINESKIWVSSDGEKTSIDEKSVGGVCIILQE
jgi:hypothetical protein